MSSVFLFLIAIINIFFLVRAIQDRNRLHRAREVGDDEATVGSPAGGGLLVRIIGPILKTVDRPWKLYPVGLLFGLGWSPATWD